MSVLDFRPENEKMLFAMLCSSAKKIKVGNRPGVPDQPSFRKI
jgi:hypothetical protein